MEAKVKPLNLTSYHSKLVGVTFEGRQDVIEQLNGDEELRFRREPENEYDSNAVAVDVWLEGVDLDNDDRSGWKPIGYIARDKNSELAELLTDGRHASIKISDITGGGEKALGVNVYIEYERKRKSERSANAELETDFFGNEIFYDKVLHEYTNALGEVYLSGSAYAGDDDFDPKYWSEYFCKAYELDDSQQKRIMAMWECNGEASRAFGTALHAAIELYGEYHDLADVIDMDLKTQKRKKLDKNTEKNSALSKLPYLNKVARKFFTAKRLKETAYYEVLIVDHKNKRAGRIDRLLVYPDGSFAVRDLKTNNKMGPKDIKGYTKQLSFYADLILANDKTLSPEPIVVHHWNENTWKDIPLTKIDTLDVLPTKSLSRQG
jgi:hypothetical protein